jgi:ABC-type dipeptide/oligopeptide/nickel transport system ATPase component
MFKPTDKISLIGRSGCGKSYLGKMIQKVFPRVIIFDSLDEYPVQENDIHTFEQFMNFCRIASDLPKFRVIVRFNIDEQNTSILFEQYMRCLYFLGDVLIVVEETQDYCSPHKIGHYFKKCLTSGRHRGLGFIFTTQRPALISKTVLSQSTHVFVGNLIDKDDSDTMGKLMARKGAEFSLLKDREFFWFCPARENHTVKINSSKLKLDKNLI